MRRNWVLALAAAAVLSPATASAAERYNFRYVFNTGETITGSFLGTAQNGAVSGISDVTMALNGAAFDGPLIARGNTAARGDGTQCGSASCFTAPAVASADPLRNNFVFSNFVSDPNEPGVSWFYIMPWSGNATGLGLQGRVRDTYYNLYNGQYVPANWSLTAAIAPVPEPATWGMMLLGVGIAGFGLRRRQGKVTRRAAFA